MKAWFVGKRAVTQHNVNLQHGGAGSSLHIEGQDTGYNMDHSTNFQVSSAVSDADIATRIITSNDKYGSRCGVNPKYNP